MQNHIFQEQSSYQQFVNFTEEEVDAFEDTLDMKMKARAQKLHDFQVALIKYALLFPKLKYLSYSTCSLLKKENEEVVNEILHHDPRCQLVDIMPEWPDRGFDIYDGKHLNRTIRAFPKKKESDGFYVALFEIKTQKSINAPQSSIGNVKPMDFDSKKKRKLLAKLKAKNKFSHKN